MRQKRVDLTGHRFGRLVVTGEKGRDGKGSRIKWYCLCDCGTPVEVTGSNLRSGNTTSCGCRRTDTRRSKTPGLSYSPEYKAWHALKYRLEHPSYSLRPTRKHRPEMLCERWQDFCKFLEDMGLRPGPGYAIGRRDPEGNFGPDNCFWEFHESRALVYERGSVEFSGVTMTVSAWEQGLLLPRRTVRERLDAGWSVERALTQDVDPDRLHRILDMRGGNFSRKVS